MKLWGATFGTLTTLVAFVGLSAACGSSSSNSGNSEAGLDDVTSSSSGSGSGGSSGSRSGADSGSSGGSGSTSSSGASSGVGDAGGDAGTCSSDADCGVGYQCGFLESAGCAAIGTCFPMPGAVCKAIELGCACDGTNINVACNGLPGGYAPKAFAHAGACGLDSGAVEVGPTDGGNLMDGATCVASGGDPCGAGLSCCPTAGYSGAPTACTPTCAGPGCAGSCRALP